MTTMGKSSTERGLSPTDAGSVATGTSETPPLEKSPSLSDVIDEIAIKRVTDNRSIQSLAALAKRRLGRTVSRDEIRFWLTMRGEF